MFKNSIRSQDTGYQVLPLQNFRHGLNTYVSADRIATTEASKLVNWMIRKGGSLVSRPSLIQYSASATMSYSSVDYICETNIGGTLYILLIDANKRLYYLNESLVPTLIGTLEGAATIMSYNNVGVIFDGSYIKYLSSISAIKMAYDGGSGTTGVQFTNLALIQDTFLALGNATNSRIAQKFTSQAWDTGYTIPITQVEVYLDKVGTPTGSVTAVLRKVSDGSLMASKVLCDASEVTSDIPTKFTVLFTSADITVEMSPSTVYYASIEYAGGDVANYVKVMCNNIGSGGLSYYYDGSWHADATKNCVLSVSPGRSPKGKFGTIWNKRPWVAGDSSNKGSVWYGNLSIFDWSTANGGGYISMVDDNSTNFEVGAMESFYGNLYVFGTQAQPYLVKISGTQPSDYAQEMTFQRPWATHKTLAAAVNDLWYSTAEGTAPVSGVQEYGDLRTFFASDPISDRFEKYWNSTTSIADYYPDDGQVWVVLDYHRVLVCHTKLATTDLNEGGARYPWSEYEFYRNDLSTSTGKWTKSGSGTNEYYYTTAAEGDPGIVVQPDYIMMDGVILTKGTVGTLLDHGWDYSNNDALGFSTVYVRDESGDPDTTGVSIRSILKPKSFGKTGSYFLIGGSDGLVYRMDRTDYKDLSTIQINPILNTAYVELPFAESNFNELQLLASSIGGGSVKLEFFVNGQHGTAAANITIALAIKDNLTVSEYTMDVEDMLFTVSPTFAAPLYQYVNFNCRSVMISMNNITMSGYPIYNNGIMLKYRRLSY